MTGKKDVNQGNPKGVFPFFTCAKNHTFSDEYSFDGDAIMIAGNGDVGSVQIYSGKFEAYQRTYVLMKFVSVIPEYLFHVLEGSLKPSLFDQKLGNTMPYIKKGMLTDFLIPLPPLDEQRRVVAVLDEAFAGIATATANAQKNLTNARALFERNLQSIFTEGSENWSVTTLGEAFDVRDGTHDSPKYHSTGFPLITSKNLLRYGLSFDDVKFIDKMDFENICRRSAVCRGDILFAMIGTIGNPTLVETDVEFAIKNVALFKIPRHQNGAFLRYYLASDFVVSKMKSDSKGATQKFVSLGYLRSFPIKLPAISEQHNLVEKLDALLRECRQLERQYERKLAALTELRQSLLENAFAGTLI